MERYNFFEDPSPGYPRTLYTQVIILLYIRTRLLYANDIMAKLLLSPASLTAEQKETCKYPETSPDCLKPSVQIVER